MSSNLLIKMNDIFFIEELINSIMKTRRKIFHFQQLRLHVNNPAHCCLLTAII